VQEEGDTGTCSVSHDQAQRTRVQNSGRQFQLGAIKSALAKVSMVMGYRRPMSAPPAIFRL